jgi:metal-responsive CopG/Arc/MetJ family transcriptional regulator
MGNTRSSMRVVSIKLPQELDEQLTEIARRRNASRSAVLREALESFARGSRRSVTQTAGDLVGSVNGPADLSASSKHMAGYGE